MGRAGFHSGAAGHAPGRWGLLEAQSSKMGCVVGMTQDRKTRYESKRATKKVSFNVETEADLLAAADALPDFSGWVKQQLRQIASADTVSAMKAEQAS